MALTVSSSRTEEEISYTIYEYEDNEYIEGTSERKMVKVKVNQDNLFSELSEVTIDGVYYTAMVIERKKNIQKIYSNELIFSTKYSIEWIVPGFGKVMEYSNEDGKEIQGKLISIDNTN